MKPFKIEKDIFLVGIVMSEVSIFPLFTELFLMALIPNIFVGRKKANNNRMRWFTKWDGQYCPAGFALVIWGGWILFEHFALYPSISGLVESFYLKIDTSNTPIAFFIFIVILYVVFRKEKW